jgi:hypothetical protein
VSGSRIQRAPWWPPPRSNSPGGGATEGTSASSGFDGSLAATGIPVVGIIVGAIGALQVGALIGGTAMLRGRGRGEHRGVPGDALLP